MLQSTTEEIKPNKEDKSKGKEEHRDKDRCTLVIVHDEYNNKNNHKMHISKKSKK